jgi:oligosaccharide repeat unit polymerase
LIQTLAILVASLVCLITSVLLFRRVDGSMSLLKLNTISYVFYFQIITSAFVGSIFLATGAIDYHPYAKPISDWVKIESWMWVMYSIVIMPLAMLAFNYIVRIRPLYGFKNYLKKDIDLPKNNKTNVIILLIMILTSVSILTFIFFKLERVPLFTLLIDGDAKQAAIDRVSVRYNLGWLDYVKNLFGLMMIPIFTYYSYIIAQVKKKWYYYLMCFILVVTSALMLTFDTQKAPLAFFVLGFLILQTFISKGIPIRYFLMFGILPILLLLVAYQLTSNHNAITLFFNPTSAFYGRVFLSGYFGFPLSLEFFPEVINQPTYYSGFPSFVLRFLDIENTESARLVMKQMNPEGVKAGTANLFSGYYLGEAYANYGYLGLIISPVIVGGVVQVVHNYLLMNKKDPLILAFYAFITVKWLLGAGVVSFLYLKIILFPFVFYIGTKILLSLFIKYTQK